MSRRKDLHDWVKLAKSPTQIERIEAFFSGHGYELHRHDTYAIGRTLSGVQSFNYCGGMRHSLPGGTMVLHPDETHDGEAGTEDGFQYRMIYIEPALIQKILGGKPLPFIPGGLSGDTRLFTATQPCSEPLKIPSSRLKRMMRFMTWRKLLLLWGGNVTNGGCLTIRRLKKQENISIPPLIKILP